MIDLVLGEDGLRRCGWCVSTPDYIAYHDDEWGQPVHGDEAFFEKLTLEAFQSGLSWLTILRKRDNFRSAFANFSIDTVAAYDEHDVERLMQDAGIIRNRRKIEATITNAKAAQELRASDGNGALDTLVWSFAPTGKRKTPQKLSDLASQTPESTALSKALKARGFVFTGPTTAHATMQATGMVNDHLANCHRR